MSHSVPTFSTPAFVEVTIINYTNGGETFTTQEFGQPTISGVIFGTVPSSSNSLGVPLWPVLISGKVKLFQFVSGVPTEIATTSALNAVIAAIIYT